MRLRPLPRLAVTAFGCLVCLLGQTGSAQTYASGWERKLFDAANVERKAHGLPALRWDPALAAAARRHSEEMAKRQSLSHQFPNEPSLPARATRAGARFTSVAENVAEAPTAAELHKLWMNSSAHRANILDGDMNSVGIGITNRQGEVFAVEDFSRAR